MPALGLRKRDRLEPSHGVPDIGSFESVDTPFVATFWRHSMETMARHRNPVIAPGLVPFEIFSIDELHTVHLAVFKNFVGFVCNAAIENDIFKVRSASLAARTQMSVERLKVDVLAWYRRDRVANPDRHQYPLQNFTVGMLGTRAAPCSLRTKAAETGTLVYYATDLVRGFTDQLPQGVELLSAGQALERYLQITRSAPRNLSVSQQQDLMDAVKRHCALLAVCALPWIPKRHLMLHMVFKYRDHRTSAWVKARTNIEIQVVRFVPPYPHGCTDDHGNQVVRSREPVLLQNVFGRIANHQPAKTGRVVDTQVWERRVLGVCRQWVVRKRQRHEGASSSFSQFQPVCFRKHLKNKTKQKQKTTLVTAPPLTPATLARRHITRARQNTRVPASQRDPPPPCHRKRSCHWHRHRWRRQSRKIAFVHEQRIVTKLFLHVRFASRSAALSHTSHCNNVPQIPRRFNFLRRPQHAESRGRFIDLGP